MTILTQIMRFLVLWDTAPGCLGVNLLSHFRYTLFMSPLEITQGFYTHQSQKILPLYPRANHSPYESENFL